jgi:predicted AlkP superfamily pyrophosphatase or phosphodiesterase
LRRFFSAAFGFLLAGLLGSGFWLTKAGEKRAVPKVMPAAGKRLIIIAIDGLDSRFIRDADRLPVKIPNLRRMMANGISADVVGIAPNLSWQSYAMAETGIASDAKGLPEVTPIWHAAAKKGLKTAAIYWPETSHQSIDFNCPEAWEGGPQNATNFDQITGRCTPGLIDRVARWDNSFIAPLWDDAVGVDIMRFLLTKEKPDLIMLHLAELGAEERETGALSLYARDVLENDDDLLGTALPKMPPGTVVAILSDHGLDTERYVVRPRVMLKAAGLADAVTVKYGLIGVSDLRAAALLRKASGVLRSGIGREVPMTEVRRLAPDVRGWVAAFDTALGYIANEEIRGAVVSGGNHRGIEGLWPAHDSSRAVFILSGPGIKHARLAEISILDEAPTFAEILGVKLPRARGTSLLSRVK